MDTLMSWRSLVLLLTVTTHIAKSQTKSPILCATGTFTEGSVGFVECLFNRNINTTDSRYNFNVVHYPTSNQSKTLTGNRVLLCNWRQGELECKTGVADGYSFDNKVSDRLTVGIDAVSEKHAGMYSCQVLPDDDIPVQTCTLLVKARNTTTPQPRTTCPDSNSAVAGLAIVLVVCLLVIVATTGILLVYYFRRKAWPSSTSDIVDGVSCWKSRRDANSAEASEVQEENGGLEAEQSLLKEPQTLANLVTTPSQSQQTTQLGMKEDGTQTIQEDLPDEGQVQVHNTKAILEASVASKDEQLAELKQRNEELEKDRMTLKADIRKLAEENKVLTENYNRELFLRKKYYNMVEDMKGKIRVYCRVRPLSSGESARGHFSVVKSPDEYSITVQTAQHGLKKFQFDQVFMPSTQEDVFDDTNNLIQLAVDGHNVCIFAYGQTGSGKTFTIIGDQAGWLPGIAPRAFKRIFQLADENKDKIKMTVTAYMLELYNDKLIDMFARRYVKDKLEIKTDKKGMVFIKGAVVKPASNTKELNTLFEEGFKARHNAPTEMNAESSRSHMIVGVVMESTDRATGKVVKGKLSLVDLAGSERVDKAGASAETQKEATFINTSLWALGNVILALSSKQKHIPYKDSKLTMLMQDSLGGDAKTLMFVNISPTGYDANETVASLEYASRVKLITMPGRMQTTKSLPDSKPSKPS